MKGTGWFHLLSHYNVESWQTVSDLLDYTDYGFSDIFRTHTILKPVLSQIYK